MSIIGVIPYLLVYLMDAINQLLAVKSVHITGTPKRAWESIVGASLSSYNRLCNASNLRADETKKFLFFAKRYKSSSHVLSAVAGYLESNSSLRDIGCRVYHPELE